MAMEQQITAARGRVTSRNRQNGNLSRYVFKQIASVVMGRKAPGEVSKRYLTAAEP